VAIYVARHGETASNAAAVIQVPQTPLNERGAEQAERLGHRLASDGIARILSSDYTRARMTAEAVHTATGAPVTVLERLRERNFGDARGRPHADFGDIYAPDFEPPGGETWDEFHRRVDRVWDEVRAAATATDGNLAVVTHGLVCYSFALRHWRLPAGQTADRLFANTGVSIVDEVAPWTARVLNCSSHLA